MCVSCACLYVCVILQSEKQSGLSLDLPVSVSVGGLKGVRQTTWLSVSRAGGWVRGRGPLYIGIGHRVYDELPQVVARVGGRLGSLRRRRGVRRTIPGGQRGRNAMKRSC